MDSYQFKNSYLYDCNITRDIENNIGDIQAPEITMEDILLMDEKFKKYYTLINKKINYKQKAMFNDSILHMNELGLNQLDLN